MIYTRTDVSQMPMHKAVKTKSDVYYKPPCIQ